MSIAKPANYLKHNKGIGFTTIINETLLSIRHTGALGVYTYLASKPEDWQIYKNQLQDHFNCGRDHIETCLKFLRDIGLLQSISHRDKAGRITHWSTYLHYTIPVNAEKPTCQESAHNTENPYSSVDGEETSINEPFSSSDQNTENPYCGNPPSTNKRSSQIKVTNKRNTTTTEIEFDKNITEIIDDVSSSISLYESEKKREDEIVDFTELRKLDFCNYDIRELSMLYERKPKLLEDSIKHLVFDEEVNKRSNHIKHNLQVFFMTIMKKGNGYNPPAGFNKLNNKNTTTTALTDLKRKVYESNFQVELGKWWATVVLDNRKLKETGLDTEPKVTCSITKKASKYFYENVWCDIFPQLLLKNGIS